MSKQPSMSRRSVLRAAALGSTGLAAAPFLAACNKLSGDSSTTGSTLKIGFVSPRTGPAAGFGEPDGYVLSLARKAFQGGLTIGGTKYEVQILDRDGQSNPQRAAQVANDLINGSSVDLMLTTSTPETTNPVSDACEAAGVPCISTVVPWEAWYFGRGAKPTDQQAFKYTFHFCFGVEQFHLAYAHLWPQIPTNKKVGVMWPNDSDGNAIRAALGPLMQKEGYTIVDPGAYPDGTNDYSAQIAKFKAENCEIFNTFPIPPDFATFWRQAAQQGYKPKIAQIAKTGLFPSQVEALGELGPGLIGTAFWTPTFPYKSSFLGKTSQELADGYQETGKQWTQMVGSTAALFDVCMALIAAAPNPKDKVGTADAISKLQVDTPLGHLDWTKGPVKNVTRTPLINCQWVKGDKYPLDLIVCDNADDKNVPVAAKLKPYTDF